VCQTERERQSFPHSKLIRRGGTTEFNGVCSDYKEEKFFYLSIGILILGSVCTCFVDYFMLHTTEKWYRLAFNWCVLANLRYHSPSHLTN
jgi:hypothetical protein